MVPGGVGHGGAQPALGYWDSRLRDGAGLLVPVDALLCVVLGDQRVADVGGDFSTVPVSRSWTAFMVSWASSCVLQGSDRTMPSVAPRPAAAAMSHVVLVLLYAWWCDLAAATS